MGRGVRLWVVSLGPAACSPLHAVGALLMSMQVRAVSLVDVSPDAEINVSHGETIFGTG